MCRVLFLILCFILSFSKIDAQVYEGNPVDSAILKFTSGVIPDFVPDTSSTPLWQIGHNYKTFFGVDSLGVTTIMTDTIQSYKINANNWFIIKNISFAIVSFWHKYQTSAGLDGGIVEFSKDTGKTWINVMGDCNTNNTGGRGILTSNFYSKTDTLLNGEAAFNGIQDTVQYSKVQFWQGHALKSTSVTDCHFVHPYNFYLRFRFVSDSISDTLAGWIIDSMKIEHYKYPGAVGNTIRQQLKDIYPNPSYNGMFIFPELFNEEDYQFEIYDVIGRRILEMPYRRKLDISQYPSGLYFYKVSDGTEYYCGQLQVE